MEESKAPVEQDEILLHHAGFKERYYASKFKYTKNDADKIRQYVLFPDFFMYLNNIVCLQSCAFVH